MQRQITIGLIFAVAGVAMVGLPDNVMADEGIQIKNASATAPLSAKGENKMLIRCWQEGKELFQDRGQGRFSINDRLLTESVQMDFQDNGEQVTVRIFNLGSALCRIETRK